MLQPTVTTALPGYQSGREFDNELVDQLEVLPELVTACGFACAKVAGYEADDFLAAAVAREERRGGTTIVATGDRDAYQLASDRTTILQPVRAGELARIGPAEVRGRYGVDRSRCPTSLPCAATAQTAYRVSPAWAPRALQACCVATAPSKMPSGPDASRPRLKRCASIARSQRWINPRLWLPCAIRSPVGKRPRSSRTFGSLRSSPSGWKPLPYTARGVRNGEELQCVAASPISRGGQGGSGGSPSARRTGPKE